MLTSQNKLYFIKNDEEYGVTVNLVKNKLLKFCFLIRKRRLGLNILINTNAFK